MTGHGIAPTKRWRIGGEPLLALAVGAIAASAWCAAFFSYEHPWALRGDNKLTFYPLGSEVWRQWSSGHLPQWSNGHWGGVPLLTDSQAASFYVPNLLVFWLTPEPHLRALDLLTAFHLGLFAAGTVRLLGALGAGRVASVFGAVLASIASSPMWWTTYLPTVEAYAWWPWLFLAAERLVDPSRPALRAALNGAVALAAQILSGYIEFAFYSACVSALWILAAHSPLDMRRRLLRGALLALLGVLFAAPQLVPTLLELGDTKRAGIPDHFAYFSIVLGMRTPGGSALAVIDPGSGRLPPMLSPFLGAATLLLALIGIRARAPRSALLAILAVVTALLTLGDSTPVYGWLVSAPGFAMFRVPYKFYLLTQLAVSWLAALGLGRLLAARDAKRIGVALACAALALGEHAIHLSFQFPQLALPHTGREARVPEALEWLRDAREATASLATAPEPPPRAYWVENTDRAYGSLGMLLGFESLNGGGGVGMLNRRSYELLSVLHLWDSLGQLDLYGVQVVLAPVPCSAVHIRGLKPVREWQGKLCLLQNPSRPPRYTLLASFLPVASEGDMIERVRTQPKAPPPVVVPPGASLPDPPARRWIGQVEVVSYRPGFVELTVSTLAPTLMLARESWSRGWSAAVDGVEVPVYPAGGVSFAMPVPQGRHAVVLRYSTPGLRIGVVGFALGCLVAGIGLWRSSRQR